MNPRWNHSKETAYKFLIDNRLFDFPLCVFEVIDRHGWGLKTDKEYMKEKGLSQEEMDVIMRRGDGAVVLEKGCYCIIYKKKPFKRQRFTIAHEIGHIVLNHLIEFSPAKNFPPHVYDILELEADVFAAALLAPFTVTREHKLKTVKEIAEFFTVSKLCAKVSMEELDRIARFERNVSIYLLIDYAYKYDCMYVDYWSDKNERINTPKTQQVLRGC